MNIVSADAIGQFPDANIAEALQRLPGISITRKNETGEGQFVVIRGLESNFNAVTVDGVRLPTTESGVRAVPLDVFSANVAESVRVTKALTPDLDGDAIGGAIDLRTPTAFDDTQRILRGTFTAGHTAAVGSDNYGATLTYGDRFGATDAWGFLVAATYLRRGTGGEQVGDGDTTVGLIGGRAGIRSGNARRGAPGFMGLEFNRYEIDRERRAVSASLDFRPDADRRFFVRGNYADLGEDRERQEFEVYADNRGENGQNLLARQRLFLERFEEHYATLSAGGMVRPRPDLRLDFAAALSLAASDRGDERIRTLRLDARWDRAVAGHPGYVKAGAKFTGREKEQISQANNVSVRRTAAQANYFPRSAVVTGGPVRHLDGNYLWGRLYDPAAARAFLAANPAGFVPGTGAGGYELFAEDVTAGYAMAGVDFGALDLLGGLRVERTDLRATFGRAAGARTAKNAYTDVLPGLHANYRFTDRLIVRSSATATLARPNFADRSGRRTESSGAISSGNPELEPISATNLDLSIERYLGSLGVVSAGVFHKRIENFIYRGLATATTVDPDTGLPITRPENGDEARITGFEFAYQQQWRMLPPPFDGLGFFANVTFLDGESKLKRASAAAGFRVDPNETFPLYDQPDYLGNVALSYEKFGVSVRVAYVYRGGYLERIDGESATYDKYLLPGHQWDFTASYRINDRLRLFGEGALQPVIDRAARAPEEPSLPEMTRHALGTLARAADGFFLMVEGTQADWAGHQNDPGMLLHELLEFDAAVREVQRFAEARDDTLVVVLSDHGCGGAVVGNARAQLSKRTPFRDDAVLAPLRRMRCSSQALWEAHGIGQSPDAATVRRVVAEHWGVEFTTAQAEEVLAIARRPERDEDFDGLGRVFSRDFTYLGWTTHEHTADDVPLYARGPGAPSGALPLTGIAHTIAQALGLELS